MNEANWKRPSIKKTVADMPPLEALRATPYFNRSFYSNGSRYVVFSPIRTVTVGSGISPDLLTL